MIGVSRSTLYKLIKSGEIDATKISNRYKVSVDSIHDYMNRKKKMALLVILLYVGVVVFVMLFMLAL